MSLAKPIYCFLLILSLSSAIHAEELIGTPIAPDTASSQIADETEFAQEDAARSVEDAQEKKRAADHEHRMQKLKEDNLLGILGIVFGVGGPLILAGFIITLVFRHRAKRREQMNQNIDKLIAAGRDVPLELLLADGKHNSTDDDLTETDNRTLNKGIKDVGLGLGLLIFLSLLCGFEIGALGFILIGLGASRIIIWKMANKTQVASNTKPSLEDNSRTEN